MAESPWIQSISDYEDAPFLPSPAFVDGDTPQALKPDEEDLQFSTLVEGPDWRDGEAYAAAAQHLPPTLYDLQHELGTSPWSSSQLPAPPLTDLVEMAFSGLYAVPQGVYSPYHTLGPSAAFEMALSPASSGWAPAGSSPHGMFGADSPVPMQQATPFYLPDEGFAHFAYEPQPLESQAKGLFSGALDSYVMPQAVYHATPPAPSVASTPSFGFLSSAASPADVSDVSDTNAASPSRWSSPGASESPESPAPAAASPAKGREATPAEDMAPNTRSRATRLRTRLPSVPQDTPSPASTVSTESGRTRPPAKKQARWAGPTATSAAVAAGAPFLRIQDMDPASRAQLDRFLIACRARKTPYSVIMDELRHIYRGNPNTLRGRLRTLTLAPKMRVRNPVWEAKHIRLLREAMDCDGCRHPDTSKISWTSVSDYIHKKTGPGSYKFSVTACSRKWQQLGRGKQVRE